MEFVVKEKVEVEGPVTDIACSHPKGNLKVSVEGEIEGSVKATHCKDIGETSGVYTTGSYVVDST